MESAHSAPLSGWILRLSWWWMRCERKKVNSLLVQMNRPGLSSISLYLGRKHLIYISAFENQTNQPRFRSCVKPTNRSACKAFPVPFYWYPLLMSLTQQYSRLNSLITSRRRKPVLLSHTRERGVDGGDAGPSTRGFTRHRQVNAAPKRLWETQSREVCELHAV